MLLSVSLSYKTPHTIDMRFWEGGKQEERLSSDKSGVVHHVSAMGVIFVKEVRGGVSGEGLLGL